MPLPDTIPVKYTEEEAEYINVRPVVKQTFRLAELVDMILSVTGKDVARVQQILHSGSVSYHFYRYWWPALDATPEELAALLAKFPDADSSRPFRPEECTSVLLETSRHPARRSLELSRDVASRKRFFRSRSFWHALLEFARCTRPHYQEYSYAHRADAFARGLSPAESASLARDVEGLAPRSLRAKLASLPEISRIIYLCPRQN